MTLADLLRSIIAAGGLLLLGSGIALLLAVRRRPGGAWRQIVSADASAARAVAWIVIGGSGAAVALAVDQALRVGDSDVTWRLPSSLLSAAAILYGVVRLTIRASRSEL